MKEQSKTAKQIVLSTAISAFISTTVCVIIVLLLKGVFPFLYSPPPLTSFDAVKCKKLWVVDDDGKTAMLLAGDQDGGLLNVYSKGPDFEKTVALSIRKSGGEITLSGPKGMVTLTAGDGIYIYDKDGNITGSLPKHAHPDTKENR